MNATLTVARKEVRDAVASKWLVLYAGIFALLALAVAYVGQRNLGELGFDNFSRTTASLLNLCLQFRFRWELRSRQFRHSCFLRTKESTLFFIYNFDQCKTSNCFLPFSNELIVGLLKNLQILSYVS